MAGIDYWEEEASLKGLAMPVAQLLIDGWATGDDAVIAALDRYAYESCDRFINETLLHLRRVYKKQVFRGSPTSDNNRPGGSSSDESVLQDFRRKSPAAQNEILMKSIGMLLYETDMYGNSLFEKKQDWIAIYLVVKSRLKIRVTQKNFEPFAIKITPADFPEDLTISSSTISNISHWGLPDTPYYMWTERHLSQNPNAARMSVICDRFWSLIKQNTYEIS